MHEGGGGDERGGGEEHGLEDEEGELIRWVRSPARRGGVGGAFAWVDAQVHVPEFSFVDVREGRVDVEEVFGDEFVDDRSGGDVEAFFAFEEVYVVCWEVRYWVEMEEGVVCVWDVGEGWRGEGGCGGEEGLAKGLERGLRWWDGEVVGECGIDGFGEA